MIVLACLQNYFHPHVHNAGESPNPSQSFEKLVSDKIVALGSNVFLNIDDCKSGSSFIMYWSKTIDAFFLFLFFLQNRDLR